MSFCQTFTFPLSGRLFSLEVSDGDSVKRLKEKIQDQEGML
jgi:hypothetical protein